VRASAGNACISSVNFSAGMGMNQEYGGPTLLATPIGIKRGLTEKSVTPSPRSAGEKVGMRGPAKRGPCPQPSPRFAVLRGARG
jgi:hypothetical protein